MENFASIPIKRGRKPLSWDEKSEKSKRDDIAAFCNELKSLPLEKVVRAVIKLVKEEGDKSLSSAIKCAWDRSDLNISNNKQRKEDRITASLSSEEALGLVLDCKLTKFQYKLIRTKINACGEKILPCYDYVRIAKASCRPAPESVIITETSASVSMQALLNHTGGRIVIQSYDFIMENVLRNEISSEVLTLTCSYGFDGSSGHSNYKQGYSSNTNASPNADSSLFVTTLIPLTLASENGYEYWRNPTPQSTRFCRPVRMIFAKETKEFVLSEHNLLEAEIQGLDSLIIFLREDVRIEIRFQLLLTIIDGKILSMLTGVSASLNCPICGKPPNEFNNLSNLDTSKFAPKNGSLLHGVSPLHCWIRFFEFLLHLSYRLPFKNWQIRAHFKPIADERKKVIQQRFWNELSLRVDYPCPGGAGTSNDGNSARRAFSDPKKLASILEIDEKLVKDLRTILVAFGSQLAIDPVKFESHCRQILFHYMGLYSWFKLPQSIHKVLVHGAQIIRASCLPLGMLSEEGSECRNKLYRQDRERHTRKMNRTVTMHDLFFRSMDTSDPVISSGSMAIRKSMHKRLPLPAEVIELLVPLDIDIPIQMEDSEIFLDDDFGDILNEVVLEEDQIDDLSF